MSTIEELQAKLKQYEEKEAEKKHKRKIAQKKYRATMKGKIANRKAQKKRYVPTGKPRGRPCKNVEKSEK